MHSLMAPDGELIRGQGVPPKFRCNAKASSTWYLRANQFETDGLLSKLDRQPVILLVAVTERRRA